jgi:S-adenosylmethionine hydrolase
MPVPVLTLTTDFGLSDHYVAAMKGVILDLCPQAQVVDISHEVKPYATAEAAYLIAQAYPCFPKGSIHVVVVDPGVGSRRRPIIAEIGGHFFVGPDNGVFGMLYDESERVRTITADRYFRRPVSQTFHGRDIFAPIAAQIACGIVPRQLGEVITDFVRPEFAVPAQGPDGAWHGCVLHIDRFGNIITSFRGRHLVMETPDFALTVGGVTVNKFAQTYTNVKRGELFALGGSSGYLEISMNQESAAARIACGPTDPAQLRL